jgi:hypothetical protein
VGNLLKAVGWFLAMGLAAFGLSLAQIQLLDRRHSEAKAQADADIRQAAQAAPPSGRSLFDPSTVVEPLGRFPSNRVVYDPAVEGRLYSGGHVSEDGGASWRPLEHPGGMRAVLLGGDRARAPAVAPGGTAVLCAEVLFDAPGTALGLGPIVHATEWRGGLWRTLVPADEDLASTAPKDLWPRTRVKAVAYLPSGESVVATSEAVLVGERRMPTPGPLRAFLATSSGEMYAAVDGQARFRLYRAASAGSAWLPVPDTGSIHDLAEGPGGALYVATDFKLGRGGPEAWEWIPWPAELRGRRLAAHPRHDLLAAWGGGRLGLSRDGGRGMRICRLEDTAVSWAAWDPFTADSVTVLDRHGDAFRVLLDSVK